jgi:hypothetical protein
MNAEACMSNHYCSGRAVSITYFECGFVALGIQHAMCMCHTVRSLSSSTIFFHISQMAQFLKKHY